MRESIGGAFLIKIMVVFLVLYNSLLAIAVNYAVAFRVKNRIIDLLEQYEGCANVGTRISSYINEIGYYRSGSPTGRRFDIEPVHTDRGNYYVVTTYIIFDFPWIRDILNIEIKGETKVIYGNNTSEAEERALCSGLELR